MYFYNELHQAQFEELIGLNQQGGQKNERVASLYVAALLPTRLLQDFKQQVYVSYTELLASTEDESPQSKRMTSSEKELIRLAYLLFHGDDDLDVRFADYLGYGYEYKEAIVQALQLHYGLTSHHQ